MLKDFIPRLYQETILDTCIKKNTLVVLPTGMGKTAIALMLAIHRLKNFPNSKILFLSPTKPLVEQHLKTFKKFLDFPDEKLKVFTGQVNPEKRAELWHEAQIIFSTPQGLSNDIISGKIDISNVSLLIVDEAHRSTGDYDYCFIAKQYNKKANYAKILALTASPGDNLEKITEVCSNLFIEEVEIRTEEDPDVKPYVQEIDIKFVKVDLTVLDAFRILKKNGPTGGRLDDVDNSQEHARRIIVSTDPVAVDAYGATLFGIQPKDVGYIRKSHEEGLGEIDYTSIGFEEFHV